MCAEEYCGLLFEGFMFGMVAAEETRSARAERDASGKGLDNGRRELGAASKS